MEDNLRKVREKSEEQEVGEETNATSPVKFMKSGTGSVIIVRDTVMGSAMVAEDNVASSVYRGRAAGSATYVKSSETGSVKLAKSSEVGPVKNRERRTGHH